MTQNDAALRVPDPARLSAVQSLCELSDPFAHGPERDALYVRAMIESVRWHRDRSPFYNKLAAASGFEAGEIKTVAGCARVPFVLANFFKSHEVLSIPKEDVFAHFTSSGTTGQKSQIFFDQWSMRSGQRMLDWIFERNGWNTPGLKTNYLLYSYETEPDSKLGTAYTDHFLCKYAPAQDIFLALRRTGTGGHDFDVFGCIETLKRYEKEGLPVRIFGFPAFLYFTLKRMRDLGMPGLKLSPQSLVFLGGGWKGNADQAIAKGELYSQINGQLGIPDSRLRDGFGSVEHPIPYVECERHQFHVPVWSQVFIRDVRTLEVLGFGRQGFLHFTSPFITSMPAHSVLMGDLASLFPGADCGCGLGAPYFVVHGRAGTSKNKSYAIAAAELLREDNMLERHLWQGEWIDDAELERRISNFSDWAAEAARESFDPRVLLDAAHLYAGQLRAKAGNYSALKECLMEAGVGTAAEVEALLAESAEFLDRANLETKLRRELGSTSPFLPARTMFRDSIFEAWAPLGLLVHVAPSNAPTAAPLSVIEGLLSGNLNFLKTSGSESWFPQLFLDGLARWDASGTLARFIVAARIPSRRKDWLERVFAAADGIAAWGGEEAMREIRKLAPSSARVVEWGHKISFAYIAAGEFENAAVLEGIAQEVCAFEQQACSSPQVLYLETGDWSELEKFAERFAPVLDRVSRAIPRLKQTPAENAEITLVTELAREEASFGQARVVESPDKSWRVLVDRRPALAASPLYRTIWLKPLPRESIIPTLRPMRAYLQTAGLACGLRDAAELSSLLLKSGAVRVRRVGDMTGSYSGEAHDGVYALQRYCRRVSVQLGAEAEGISSFADLRREAPATAARKPKIMTKADFQAMKVDEKHAQLFFKSGGSSGEPKLSVFTYDDYHEQMRAGAEGLYAAGLDPLKDRSMNLFFSGSLYGGFLSIFSVLEELKAVHFPMAAQTDLAMVAEAIVKNKVNVLLGMPSYVVQLFEQQSEILREAKIGKIFYGGEHFNEAQRRYLGKTFGIGVIKSIGYGSVDAGPLGYQCRFCDGGAHHFHQRLQYLEILDLEKDEPVKDEAVGRLVFTSRVRRGQTLERYDLGDVGHRLAAPCPCGRSAPRFRLLGRSGDVFRIGTSFFNYQKFAAILSESLGHAGAVQVVLDHDGLKEKITVRLSQESRTDAAKARSILLESDHDLAEVVEGDKVLLLDVVGVPSEALEKTKGSGKLVRILDRRTR